MPGNDQPIAENSPTSTRHIGQVCRQPATSVVRSAPPAGGSADGERTVALTFDDGPGRWTSDILDVLRKNDVHATFFVVGKQLVAEPETLQQIVAAGHALGNHSWSHNIPSESAGWNPAVLAEEIERTDRAILDITGRQPCVFRPPGGVVDGATDVSVAAGLSLVLWSVDTRDWSGQHARDAEFASVIRERARQGLAEQHPVILLHDGGGYRGATVTALDGIIEDYRAAGYRFVTVDGRR
ncbi:MAG: polysaccharide deacetylase family protein [Jiangellaceae bacterium]|nr:polysaccharide deacetylase family protein [Jiangellaceae bacterium]